MDAYRELRESEKRVARAIEMAKGAMTKPGLQDVYLKRFHRAMDSLSRAEGEAVYAKVQGETWYQHAKGLLERTSVA